MIAVRVEADRRAKQIARLDGRDLAAGKATLMKQWIVGLFATGGCVAHTGSSASFGVPKCRPFFALCFRNPDFSFPRNSSMNERVQNYHEKLHITGSLLMKNVPFIKFIVKRQGFPQCTLKHMTHPSRQSMHHSFTPKSQVFTGILTTWCDPQRSVFPWSTWRPEAFMS